MRAVPIGIGELMVSNQPGDILRSYGLGSCIGLVILAPKQRVVGMLHIALPESKINHQLAQDQPGMFADTGIPCLLQEMERFGCHISDLVIKIAGGASVMDPGATFEIGKRNILAVKKTLWRYRLGPVAEDIGDVISRTLSVSVDTGVVTVSSPRKGEWDI